MNIKDYKVHVGLNMGVLNGTLLLEEYNKIIHQRIAGQLSAAIQGKLPIHITEDPLGRKIYKTSVFLLTEVELEEIIEQNVQDRIRKTLEEL